MHSQAIIHNCNHACYGLIVALRIIDSSAQVLRSGFACLRQTSLFEDHDYNLVCFFIKKLLGLHSYIQRSPFSPSTRKRAMDGALRLVKSLCTVNTTRHGSYETDVRHACIVF